MPRKLVKKKILGDGFYDSLVNKLINPTVKLKNGEKHTIMWNPNKKGLLKFDVANFSGPGTELVTRIKNKIKGLNVTDKTANAHDIRYTMAKNEKDIQDADNKMVMRLSKAQKNKEDYKFNILPSKLGIQAKQLLGKIGVPTSLFTTYDEFDKLNEEDKTLLKDRLKELEEEGYGKRRIKKIKLGDKKFKSRKDKMIYVRSYKK